MNKTRLGVIAIVFALVAASCSSSDDAEVATAVAEAPTESATAAPTVAATPTATATPESDCGVALLLDPDPEVEIADVIARVVDGFSYCLRLPQATSNQEFTEFYTSLTELYTSLSGLGTYYTELVETYGSEAAFVLTIAASIGFGAVEANTLTEIPNNFCSTLEDEFYNEYTGLYILYTGILSDEVLACVRQASTSERQQAITDLADTFGEEAIAKLVELYGVEATIVILSTHRILSELPSDPSTGESNCDPVPVRTFGPDTEITDAIATVVDGLIFCFRNLPNTNFNQEFAGPIEFAAGILGEETHAKLVETYGNEATLIFTVLFSFVANDASFNEDSREIVAPTETSSNFCSTVEDEFSNANTMPGIGTLLDEVMACVEQASTSERQQAITDLGDTFGEEVIAKVTELYGVEATIAISSTFGIAFSLFPLQRDILKS